MKAKVVLLSICLTPAFAEAHSFVSTQFIAGEKAIAELQARRDTMISNPAASAQEKQAAQAYVATAFAWNKLNLSVCFWQVDDPQFLEAVKKQANLWTNGTRVRFNFGDGAFRQCQDEKSADIRITFKPLASSFYAKSDSPLVAWDWSEYGSLPSQLRAKVSMSLVHAPEDYKLATTLGKTVDFNFLVAHEFGHALGLIHEHQRIDCSKYLASKAQVKEAYGFTKDSDYDTFVLNVKQIPPSDPTLRPIGVGEVDVAHSVTVYNFPVKIWANGSNPCARPDAVDHPDSTDIAGVNYLYGAPAPQAAAVVSSRRGGETPIVAQEASPAAASSSAVLSNEEARQVLLQSYQTHLRIAQGLENDSLRGGGSTPEERKAAARARRRSAAEIQGLFDAMKHVRDLQQ